MADLNGVSPVVGVIDDDKAIRDSLEALLTARGLGVKTFESALAFLSDREGRDCQCLLIDMQMPGMTGLALLLALRERGIEAPAIVITAAGDQVMADQVARAGAVGLLRKPVEEDELFAWIDRALAPAKPD
jgi:FixJ family two-component response regulator